MNPIEVLLTPKEAYLLSDMIDIQVEGMLDAKGISLDDNTFKSIEDYLSSMGQYDEDVKTLQSIKERLHE